MKLPILAALLVALLVPTLSADEMPAKSRDIVDVAIASGSFKTLVTAVQKAGLVETLKGDGPFTVFAPTDEAFAKLPEGTIEALLKDRAALTRVLTYHVVPGRVPAAKVAGLQWLETAQGQSLRVTKSSDVRVDGAKVIAADVAASNGVIHVIDRVVLPRPDLVKSAVDAGAFKTLVAAVQAAGLVDTLRSKGPFTVFAPTDTAFGKLPEGTVEGLLENVSTLKTILTYHVVPGRVLAGDISMGTTMVATVEGRKLRVVKGKDGGVTVNGAKVVSANVIAGNGVIHVIDTVILPE